MEGTDSISGALCRGVHNGLEMIAMGLEEIRALMDKYITHKDGKSYLACRDAFLASAGNGIPLSAIVGFCHREDIQIRACQLGCFK